MTFSTEEEAYARTLFKIGALRLVTAMEASPSTATASQQRIEMDFRLQADENDGKLTGLDLYQMSELMFARARDDEVFRGPTKILCGMPGLGDEIAFNMRTSLAVIWNIPSRELPLIRLRTVKYGERHIVKSIADVSGLLFGGKNNRVVLLDTHVSSIDATLRGIQTLREQGFTVTNMLVLVDCGVDCTRLQKEDVAVSAVFKCSELVHYYEQTALVLE